MKKLLDAAEFDGALRKLATDIAEAQKDFGHVAFVGIQTRGIPLAERLAVIMKERGKPVLRGLLDINLYRDDLSLSAEQPVVKETRIDFDVDGKVIYLCDDVLYTGRTVRAAMDALFDLGRPKAIHLVVLARRNGRELPIDASFYALDVATKPGDNIKVKFAETDGKDDVTLLEEGEY
jgi:pyrimidine operon attenuation protein/uracil phosphoribosyltransferase